LAAEAPPVLPAALPATGGDLGAGAGGAGQASILTLVGLALAGGGAWAMASLRRKETD
jgi:hypothetical protein